MHFVIIKQGESFFPKTPDWYTDIDLRIWNEVVE